MARTSKCKLCGGGLDAGVAAHACPHGNWCRYLCDEGDMPIDWMTPECDACKRGERADTVVHLGASQRTLSLFEDDD